jgi:hypothetical protein
MLGLDVNSLAVADYEIISRMERIITSFNEGLMTTTTTTCVPTAAATPSFQPMCIQPLPYDYSLVSSSTSAENNNNNSHYHHKSHHKEHHHSSSGSLRHSHSHQDIHHSAHRHSQSPHRVVHVSRTIVDSGSESPSVGRTRSKSPRKVTIDPKAY